MKSSHQSKPWHLLGAGAIGCLWAIELLRAGLPTTLILRNATRLAAFRRGQGITAVTETARKTYPCEARLAGELDTPIHQLLICCKAQQSQAAFTSVADKLAHRCTVVLLQNGMGIAQMLLAQRPDIQLFCGVSTDGAHLIAPFTVVRAGRGRTLLGLHPQDNMHAASDTLCRQLRLPNLDLQSCHDIYGAQWQKLAINSIINPLTAIFDLRNGELLGHPGSRQLLGPLCREVEAASNAQGIILPATELEALVVAVCQQTADNISSMLQDIRHRRPTEIAFINGYLIRLASESGLDCPTHRELVQRIEAIGARFR